jgi:hypothetical protein
MIIMACENHVFSHGSLHIIVHFSAFPEPEPYNAVLFSLLGPEPQPNDAALQHCYAYTTFRDAMYEYEFHALAGGGRNL